MRIPMSVELYNQRNEVGKLVKSPESVNIVEGFTNAAELSCCGKADLIATISRGGGAGT